MALIKVGAHLETLPGWANRSIGDLLAHIDHLDQHIDDYDRSIAEVARADQRSKRLMQLPGVGPITSSALLASIGSTHDFANGRQLAAWLGLTPGQYSSGGKTRLGRITKAGDPSAGDGRPGCLGQYKRQNRPFQLMGQCLAGTTWLLESRRRHCHQERQDGVGGIGIR